MNQKSLLFGLLLITVFSCQINPGHSQAELIPLLTETLVSLFKTGHLEFLGHPCQFRIRPKIRKFKLKYDGKMWCPGWTPFSGRALKSSRSGAVEHAIKDYIEKAIAAGIVKQSEAQFWLQNYN